MGSFALVRGCAEEMRQGRQELRGLIGKRDNHRRLQSTADQGDRASGPTAPCRASSSPQSSRKGL